MELIDSADAHIQARVEQSLAYEPALSVVRRDDDDVTIGKRARNAGILARQGVNDLSVLAQQQDGPDDLVSLLGRTRAISGVLERHVE